MKTTYVTPTTAPPCPKCGEPRTAAGDKWVCIPCRRQQCEAGTRNSTAKGPLAKRQYVEPPASEPWTDEGFRKAVAMAAFHTHRHVLGMAIITHTKKGYAYAADPGRFSFEKTEAIVAPEGGGYIVYRCAEAGKQYRVPAAWLSKHRLEGRPTGDLPVAAQGFAIAVGSAKPVIQQTHAEPSPAAAAADCRPIPAGAPWSEETFQAAVRSGCGTMHFRKFGEFSIVQNGPKGHLARHSNTVNASDRLVARIVFSADTRAWCAVLAHGRVRYAIPQEWTHAK